MSSNVSKKFALKLKALRKAKNYSQEEFAAICGVDRTYIGRLERVERTPSLIVLQKIADGFKITLSDLLKFD